MKIFFLFVFGLLMAGNPITAKIVESHYKVSGMVCAACEAKVSKAIQKLKGIDSVQVKRSEDIVTVTYHNKKVNKQEIFSAIKSTGYKSEILN